MGGSLRSLIELLYFQSDLSELAPCDFLERVKWVGVEYDEEIKKEQDMNICVKNLYLVDTGFFNLHISFV